MSLLIFGLRSFCPFTCTREPVFADPVPLPLATEERFLRPSDPLHSLRYLATFHRESRCPYTQEQAYIFRRSWQAGAVTLRCLQIGIFVTSILSSMALLSAIKAYRDFANSETDARGPIAAAFIFASASWLSSTLSFVATGTFPHQASEAANRSQDAMREVQDYYERTLVPRLLVLNTTHRDQAVQIAQNLQRSLPNIRAALRTHNPNIGQFDLFFLIRALDDAIRAVLAPQI